MSFSAPESLTPAEFQGILEYLRILLQNLPTALPVSSAFTSKYLAFLSFTIDAELLDRTGSEIGALNEQFKQIFGWQTRTTGSGIVAIEERGEAICAVVDVLEDFHVRYPTDNVIKKWAVDIGIGLQEVYTSEDSEDLLDDVEDDVVDCHKDDEMPEDDFLQVDEDIHLGSPLLRDLISTVPVVGSQNVRVAQDNVRVSKKRVTNWNF
ncbi:hypothetical protein BDR04DRAFT_1141453 [Suillus decipiens]|nr:hypothetical protein BDR04DRAFT_1141453 [Suillus decipiens]